MGHASREDQTVVTSDGHSLGKVVGRREGCVLVETGHVFKSTHAIPESFLHEHDGELRATVARQIVTTSPKVDGDGWDVHAVLLHYGLEGPFEVDPDPNSLENAETEGLRHDVDPAPHQRLGLDETDRPGYDRPAVRDRQANANDPTGVTANRTIR